MHRPTQRRDSLRERVLAGRVRRDTRDRRAAAARKGSRRMVALFAGLAMVAGVITATQLTSSAGEDREQGLGEGGTECEVAPTEEAPPEEDTGAEGEDANNDGSGWGEGEDANNEDANNEDSGWGEGGEGGEFSTSDAPGASTGEGELVAIWHEEMNHWMMVTPERARDWEQQQGDDEGSGEGAGEDSEPGDDESNEDCNDDGDNGDGAGDGDNGDGDGDGDNGDGDGDNGDGDNGDGAGDGDNGDGDGDNGDGDNGDGDDNEFGARQIQSCDDSPFELHDGFESAEERCIATQQGEQSALENNPQLLFTEFPQQLAAGEPVQYTVSTQNFRRTDFPAAGDGGYYQRPAALAEDGLTEGHFHTGCRQVANFDQAPEPNQQADVFVAVEDGGGGFEPDFVEIEFEEGLEAGEYQCMAWAGSANHSSPPMSFAQTFIAVDTFRLVVE